MKFDKSRAYTNGRIFFQYIMFIRQILKILGRTSLRNADFWTMPQILRQMKTCPQQAIRGDHMNGTIPIMKASIPKTRIYSSKPEFL